MSARGELRSMSRATMCLMISEVPSKIRIAPTAAASDRNGPLEHFTGPLASLDLLRHFFDIRRQKRPDTSLEANATIPSKSDDRRNGMVGLRPGGR